MTEPPEDNVHGDDAYDDEELTAFLNSEYFAEMGDDMLIDRVARGEDNRTVYDEYDDVEDQLEDDLHDIKEQAEDEPIPELVSVEEASRVIAEAKKAKEEREAAERRTQSQGEDKVAISDDAQQIAQIAGEETAKQAMESAISSIADAIGQLQQAGQTLTSLGQNLQAAGEAAASQASTAGNLLGGDEGQAIAAQGQEIAQAISDALSKIAFVDVDASVGKLQGVDLASLQGRIQALSEAIKAAALKHQ